MLNSPWWIISLGVVAFALLAAAYMSTRRTDLMWSMVGVVALVLVGVVLERIVVTDVEKVQNTLYDAAAAAETNDVEALKQYIAPSAERTLARVEERLERFEVNTASVTIRSIKFNDLTTPPMAEAEFIANVGFVDRHRMIPYKKYPCIGNVVLELHDGRWLVSDHVEFRAMQ
ncbi:MAG: hypothetical protein ACYTG0_23830 [Planctomycetota bacterium]|jgi:hypothetical protein